MTVRELLARMDSAELSEWQVYTSRFDPLPDSPREAALLASTMVNLWSKSKTTPDDFLPLAPEPRPVQSADDGLRVMRSLVAARKRPQ